MLITELLEKDIEFFMSYNNDGMCVDCFAYTGYLINILSYNEYDANIGPQGTPIISFLFLSNVIMILMMIIM